MLIFNICPGLFIVRRDNSCLVAAGSELYLHTLSAPEGGAVFLPVIKLFTRWHAQVFMLLLRYDVNHPDVYFHICRDLLELIDSAKYAQLGSKRP